MADVTYTFAADDTFMMQALRRQEQAIHRTAGTIDQSYAQASKGLDKFVFGTARLGQAAAAGIAASGYLLVDMIRDFGKENQKVGMDLSNLEKQWSGLKSDYTRDVLGGGDDLRNLTRAVGLLREYRREAMQIAALANGGVTAGVALAAGLNGGVSAAIDQDKALDEQLKKIREMERVRRQAALAARGQDTVRLEFLRMNGSPLRADLEEADTARARKLQDLQDRIREANTKNEPLAASVVAQERATILDEHRLAVARAYTREEEELGRIRQRNGEAYERMIAEREDRLRESITRSARESDAAISAIFEADAAEKQAGIEEGRLRAASMRARGLEKESALLDAQLGYQQQLLEIESNRLISDEARARLTAAAGALLASQVADIENAATRTAGGRGIDAGLASAPGVISGGLVTTARDNPSAMIQQSNRLLERILKAIGDQGGAVFAP